MTYGYDEALLFPVRSLYDTGMINLYIQSVQREYERGLADLKEFIAKYGDFTSPIARDIEAWDQATVGAYGILMQELLKQGIDPVRSQEGRAAINNFIMTRPYGELAKLRQSAETAKKYQDMAGELKAKGLYSQELEDFMGVGNLGTWDTSKNGMWITTSPTEFKDLNQLTSHWFDGLKDTYLGKDPNNNLNMIIGVSEAQMDPVLDSKLPGFLATQLGQYYLKQAGGDLDTLKSNIKNANKEVLHQTPVVDQAALSKWQQSQANRAARHSGGGHSSSSHHGGEESYFKYTEASVKDGMSVHGDFEGRYSKEMAKIAKENPGRFTEFQIRLRAANNIQYSTIQNSGFYKTVNASMALSHYDPSEGFYSRMNKNQFITITNGEKTETDYNSVKYNKAQIRSIGEVSGRALGSGVKTKKGLQPGKYKHEELSKKGTPYYVQPAEGNRHNIITQYEKDGRVHQYRAVNVYDKDNNVLGQAWWDLGAYDRDTPADRETNILYYMNTSQL